MRRWTGVFLALVLASTMAVAQSSSSQPSNSGQSPSKAQTPMTAPHTTRGDRSASQVDRGTQPDQNSAAATQDQGAANAPATTQPQTPVATPSATQRANTGGSGVPWGWIIVGIIVIAIILALIGRGSDRSEVRREREIERDRLVPPTDIETRRERDDDIRRVG